MVNILSEKKKKKKKKKRVRGISGLIYIVVGLLLVPKCMYTC
jgi:multisubunit Na+/H+ antiporter MnhB subunit